MAGPTSDSDAQAYHLLMGGLEQLRLGNAHPAVVLLDRAKRMEPDKGSIREALARALYQAGHTARARREFAKAVQIDPVNDYAHFGLALSCAKTGQRVRAIAHLKLALAMSPGTEAYEAALEQIAG